jgi:hypothetical protein
MKNFDEEYVVIRLKDGRPEPMTVSRNERAQRPEEERTFVIGGETFVYRPSVPPEGYKRWSAMTGGEFILRDAQGKPVLDPASNTPISTLTEDDALAILDETVISFLEPQYEEAWRRVRAADAPNPLTLDDIRALIRWLFEEQTGRPTGRSSDSSNGSRTADHGTRSTDASSSQAAEV